MVLTQKKVVIVAYLDLIECKIFLKLDIAEELNSSAIQRLANAFLFKYIGTTFHCRVVQTGKHSGARVECAALNREALRLRRRIVYCIKV